MTGAMVEVYTVDLAAYEARFGETPQVGHFLTHPDGQRAGAVVEVLDCYTVKVAWKERKGPAQKRNRKTVHHVTTPQKYGIGWLVAQDTMNVVNAVYSGE